MQEILSKLCSGVISQAEAEEQIKALSQPKPKMKRDRPKKAKAPPKKNGRPRRLSKLEKDMTIMASIVVLNYLYPDLKGMKKRSLLSKKYCVSEKKIDALITDLNRRAKKGEVFTSHETHEVLFTNSSDEMQAHDQDGCVYFGRCSVKKYMKG